MTEIDEKEYLEDAVYYECAMLINSFKELKTIDLMKKSPYSIYNPQIMSKKHLKFMGNIFLEVFLIHARNLFHFFSNHGQSNDVYANRYVNGFEKTYNAEMIKQISKRLAHLTEERNLLKIEWDTSLIYNILLTDIKDFLNQLPEKYKGKNIYQIGTLMGIYKKI